MARSTLDQVIHIILGFLFPTQCRGCGVKGTMACTVCLEKAQRDAWQCFFCKNKSVGLGLCALCKKSYPIDGIIWAFSFRAPVIRGVIHDIKYKRRQDEIELLAPYLEKVISRIALPHDSITVPIPLHPRREKQRGYNQAERIAAHIGRRGHTATLSRTKDTPPQARTISKQERFVHIQGAFAVINNENLSDKNFLLIDDVATTGATITEAARTLKQNGAKKVYAAVLAH